MGLLSGDIRMHSVALGLPLFSLCHTTISYDARVWSVSTLLSKDERRSERNDVVVCGHDGVGAEAHLSQEKAW